MQLSAIGGSDASLVFAVGHEAPRAQLPILHHQSTCWWTRRRENLPGKKLISVAVHTVPGHP